jgi:peroxiredoxin
MPGTEGAAAVGSAAPPLRLPDQTGRIVDLDDFLDRRVVVVFYRGFW